MEDNLWHAISNLQYVSFHVVAKNSSHTLNSIVHTTNIEITPCVKEVVYKSVKTMENY